MSSTAEIVLTWGSTRRNVATTPCLASATAMVRMASVMPMPRPYARNVATPDAKLVRSSVVATIPM